MADRIRKIKKLLIANRSEIAIRIMRVLTRRLRHTTALVAGR